MLLKLSVKGLVDELSQLKSKNEHLERKVNMLEQAKMSAEFCAKDIKRTFIAKEHELRKAYNGLAEKMQKRDQHIVKLVTYITQKKHESESDVTTSLPEEKYDSAKTFDNEIRESDSFQIDESQNSHIEWL